MNTIPITLTLYYPTMAQVESYAGFISMLSIAFGFYMLSLPLWRWRPHTTMNKRKPLFVYLLVAMSPVGSILIAAQGLILNKEINALYGWFYLFAPFFLVYAF